MKTVVITGANRGLGLEFVIKLLKQSPPPSHIIATYRSDQGGLTDLAKKNPFVHPLKLDVSDFSAFCDFAKKVEDIVGQDGLTVLINNAGIMVLEGNLEGMTVEKMLDSYRTNTIAPLELTKVLLPLLKKAAAKESGGKMSVNRAAVINITSKMGSIADNTSGRMYSYRCSKAALNIGTVSLSRDLAEFGILAVVLHPGWVKTDLGGKSSAIHTVDESIDGMLAKMAALGKKDNGGFFDFKGNELPW